MTKAEAKAVLIAARRGDDANPEFAEAFQQMERDPELREWFEGQQRFHSGVRASLGSIPVPLGLRERILAGPKVVSIPWWRQRSAWLAAAAAIVLFATLIGTNPKPKVDDSLATFRARMVRTVLRQYRMDIVTNDVTAVKRFLVSNKAPSDYTLPTRLERTSVTGAGVLTWQAQPVSMVCFDGGKAGTLFLFITDAAGVKLTGSKAGEFARVNSLTTVWWTDRDKVYVLAADSSEADLRRYL